MGTSVDGRFDDWLAALEARYLADLAFPEVTRALRALSSAYVERRAKLAQGSALSGAGKRAAFALFYGPIHYLLVRRIVQAIHATGGARVLLDLGCGTGVSSAAWAGACTPQPRIIGIDRNRWAVAEAARTYQELGLDARARVDDFVTAKWQNGPALIVAAFAVNEVTDGARDHLLARLLERVTLGDRVLIVEPLARFVAPWWGRWRDAFESNGGRADDWRFNAELPPIVAKLDRAAGLDHHELTGRSLWCG